MKRILSLLLVFVMVFSMIPQAAFADDVDIYDLIHDDYIDLRLGENTVTVSADKDATVFYFQPTEEEGEGSYTISGPEGYVVGISGYNWVTNLPTGTNSFDWNCTGIGQTVIVGVSGAAGEIKLNITKTGEIQKDPDPVAYVNQHTPSKGNILTEDKYCTTVEAVDSEGKVGFTAGEMVLKGEFYYVGNNPVYVDLQSSKLSIVSALSNPGLKYYEYDGSGKLVSITDYRAALSAYVGADPNSLTVMPQWTKYPLTVDLVTMLSGLDKMNGWTGGAFVPNGWIELCYLVVADHTPGDRVIDGDNYTVSCTVCKKVLETGTVEPEPTEPELGSAENPIMLELQWGDDGIMGVTTTGYSVPAGKTVYLQAYGLGGLNVVAMLSAGPNMLDGTVVMNGVEMPAVAAGTFNAVATGNPRMPTTFAVTNNSETDGKIFFNVNHILGSRMNPEWIESMSYNVASVSLAEGDDDGYYYTYTAEGDGTVTFYFGYMEDAPEADIVVMNNNTYQQKSLLMDGVDNYGLELTMDVSKGDVLMIQVVVVPDESWNIPAADLEWIGNYTAVPGTEANPFEIEWIWNDAYTEATATVEVAAGATVYYNAMTGMIMTVNGKEFAVEGMTFCLTNEGEEAAVYELAVSYPVGTYENPDQLVLGENTAKVEENTWGYYFTWTGIEDGGILVITMAEDSDWTYVANNLTSGSYGETQWSNEDPKNPCYIMVNEGEEIQLIVNTFDPENPYTVPEGTVKFEVDYVAPYGSEGNRAFIGFPDGQYDAENWTYGYAESGLLPDTSYYKSNFGYDKNNPQELFINGEKIEYTVEFGEDGYVEEFYTITNEGEPYVMVSVFLAKPNATLTVAFADMMGAELKQNTEGKYYVSGVVKSVDDAEKGILTIQDEEGNTLTVTGLNSYSVAYNELEVKPAAGDTVTVYGVLGQADGVAQMVNANLEAYDCAHDVKYVEAVAATCYENGNVEYWTCTKCGAAWLDEECTKNTNLKSVVTPMGHGEIIHVPYNKPTGAKNGNLEHWYCEDCGQAWLDAECTKNTNLKAVVLPATGECDHENVQYKEAVAPGCHYNGNIEYWVCYDCESWWADEALTQVTTSKSVVLPYTGSEKLQHIDAVAATCFENGNIEHWYCPECEQFWQDEALTQVTNAKRVIVPMAHQELTHVEAVAATCFENGNIEYWTCEACDYAWLDAEGIQSTNLKAVVTPAAHAELTHVEAVEATCYENGNIEYWTCETCGYAWLDAEGVQSTNLKSVVTPMGHGEIIAVEAKEPTCEETGNIAYWYCEDCGQAWLDAECTRNTNLKAVVLPITHNVLHKEAIEPGCHMIGNVEYWYCSKCGAAWTDEACNQVTNLKNVILPATGSDKVVHFEAVEPACHYNGNVEYWYCPDCEGFWTDEACTVPSNSKRVILPAVGGEVIYFEAVEPACHYNGNVEYWYCPDCENFWTDEALTKLSNSKRVILPATGGENVEHVEALEPTCNSLGNVEYWHCADCDQYWTDEACTVPSNAKNVLLGTLDHDTVYFEAVKPGCHSNGNVEYWFCPDCEGFWTDEDCTEVTNSKRVILPAIGSENVVHFDAVEPGCHSNGNVEYWYCPDCEGFWTDEACTVPSNSKNVVLPATGSENVVHFEAIEPGCHDNGQVEYWFCADCEGFWTDEACTQVTNSKSVILPATGEGNVQHFEAVAPACHYEGNVEYWHCYDCGKVWTDKALTQLSNVKNVILPAVGGVEIHVEAKESTCTAEGNVEYWYCEECEQVWTDAALTQLSNFKNVITAKKDHTPDADGITFQISEKKTKSAGDYVAAYEFVCENCGDEIEGEAETTYEVVEDATCDEDGQGVVSAKIELNGKVFEAAKAEKKTVTIAATGHNVVHVEEVKPGCHMIGNQEHWYCTDCEIVWADEAKTQVTNHKNVIVPALGGEVVHVKAVKATCVSLGNVEHWYCEECEQVWTDEALTQLSNHKNVIIPIDDDAHTAEWKVTKEATCTAKGEKTLKCTLCNEVLEKKDIAMKDHELEWEQTKDPTCYAKGEKVHKCQVCGHVAEKKDIAMTKHVDKNKDGECDVKQCKADLTNQKTGDMIMIAVVVMLLAGAAIVVLLTKKRRAK